MNIQYRHNPEAKRSYAVIPPFEMEFDQAAVDLMTLGKSNLIPIFFGVAKVHPLDNFDRTVGRQVAEANLQACYFKLFSFRCDSQASYYNFLGDKVSLVFKRNHGTPKFLVVEVATP